MIQYSLAKLLSTSNRSFRSGIYPVTQAHDLFSCYFIYNIQTHTEIKFSLLFLSRNIYQYIYFVISTIADTTIASVTHNNKLYHIYMKLCCFIIQLSHGGDSSKQVYVICTYNNIMLQKSFCFALSIILTALLTCRINQPKLI